MKKKREYRPLLGSRRQFKPSITIIFVLRCFRDNLPGGGGGGGTLIFSAYVGSDPASTVHPKKYQKFQAPQKNI